MRAWAAIVLLAACFDRGRPPAAFCGDHVVDPGEACDDGNRDPTDGCDLLCRISTCGNGVVDGNERCDDGARRWGDEGADGVACQPDCSGPERPCDAVPAPSWCDVESLVLATSCSATLGCHRGAARDAATLNLEAGAWQNLVCAPALTADGSGRCLVVPRDLEASYLWSRLTGDGLGDCDFRCHLMPAPNGGLCHEVYDAIREWVLSGAPGPNGEPAPDCEPGCTLPAGFDPGGACPGAGEDAGPADAGPADAAPDAG